MDSASMLQAGQAVGAVALIGAALGSLLGVAARRLAAPPDERCEAVVALLPGSNCAQCGFAGCRQAAAAMVEGRAAPTCCPPGGQSTARRVAELLNVRLDAEQAQAALPRVARVEEDLCTGCMRCIRKCSADAIVGAPKQMHTVMQEACFACELCARECPTGAISMHEVAPTLATWHWPKPVSASSPALR